MYNWRLLLALVAIFQPITSFTERNLVDGRQACCGGQTDSLLRDSKSSLPGAHRQTSLFHGVTDRDDTREDRRYEIRQRDTVLSRRSTDRYHPANRDESGRRYSITTRSDRVEYRSRSAPNDEHRDRRLGVQRRIRDARNILNLESDDQTYRNLNRNRRDSALRLDDRIRLSRNAVPSDENQIRNNIREPRDLDSRRERMQFGSGNRREFTPRRDARDNVRHLREDVIDISNDNRRESRPRIMAVRRESLSQDDRRSYIAREDRAQAQRREQRRSLSDNVLIEQNYDLRENSRAERNANFDRGVSSRRLISERVDDNRKLREDVRNFREQIRENADRRLSGERMQLVRREIRDSRQVNRSNLPTTRKIESRRDVRYDEKLSANFRDENRLNLGRSMRTDPLKRDIRVDRRARSLENGGIQNIRHGTDLLHRSNEVMHRRDESRKQVEYRSKMETRERETYERRSRNERQTRHRELEFDKVETESEIGSTNWQYMLYTVQAVYLCGLLLQLLTPNYGKKSSLMDIYWWPVSSQERIKVD